MFYTYFLTNALAERWPVAFDAFNLGLHHAPDSTLGEMLKPAVQWLRSQYEQDGCAHCAQHLTPVIEGMLQQNKDIGVCSSVSGNFNSVDKSLLNLVQHMKG